MKQLIASRAIKAVDQVAMSEYGATQYVPLYNRSTWTQPFYGEASQAGLAISTVYACVRLLAESVAQLPLILYRRSNGEQKDRATDTPLYGTLHDQANPEMTAFTWRELLMSHVVAWGNHYSEKVYDSLGRLNLYPIRPDRMEVKYGSDGQKVYTYLSPLGTRQEMKPGTIFHVPGLSSNGLVGLSPIALHMRTLQLAETAQDFGTNYLANGARPGVVLSHPKTLSDNAVKRLGAQMDELRGSRNAGKTVVLEEGLTVTEIGVPPQDAQYIETRKFQRQIIASEIFRIPPHMVGDLESGASYASIETMSLEFVLYTLMPWLVRIEQEIRAQLLPDDGIFAEFLVDGLLRGDAKSRAEAFSIRWQHGTLTADEWRAKENENPLPDGIGKQTYVPVNYAVATPPGQEAVAPSTVRQTVTETQPPAPMDGPNQPIPIFATKSMGEPRCVNPDCKRKLADSFSGTMSGHCPRCKTPYHLTSEEPAALKAASRPEMDGLIAGLQALREPPTITVNPTPVTVDSPNVTVSAAPIDLTPVAESIAELSEKLTAVTATRQRKILRDEDGRITGMTEWIDVA